MDRSRSAIPLVIVIVAVALAVAVAIIFMRAGDSGRRAPESEAVAGASAAAASEGGEELEIDTTPLEQTEEEILADAGVGVRSVDAAGLVERIGRALEQGDVTAATRVIGRDALDERTVERLREMVAEKSLRLHPVRPFSEVGELKLNEETRWALNLEGNTGRRILLDLTRQEGRWSVKGVTLPEAKAGGEAAARPDALGVTDAFVRAVVNQEFAKAQTLVDPAAVSDAKIAALCILFEEGHYRLRERKPLRAMLVRENAVGYLANIEAADDSHAAQFSLTLHRDDPDGRWRIADLNLDELLAEYARRVGGGDTYYTPLVKNPEGGDTLVLYFGFDEAGLSPRMQRQLEIVAVLLRSDPAKRLTISGHTDSLGGDHYNDTLSGQRALAVKEFLAGKGVDPVQIVTEAVGAAEPRRPNVLEDGTDNPEGRRANRRTEIFLDF